MPNRKKKVSGQARYLALNDALAEHLDALNAWWTDEDDFIEIRVKKMDDGSFLAIARGYDAAGGNVVCFGGGYGVVGAFLTISGAIHGNRWRVEQPWPKEG